MIFNFTFREETLLNVMKSVTKNKRSIFLTMLFAVILVYLFSIVGFLFFRDDFMMEAVKLTPDDMLEADSEDGSCSADQISCNSKTQMIDSEGTKERYCDSLGMCLGMVSHKM